MCVERERGGGCDAWPGGDATHYQQGRETVNCFDDYWLGEMKEFQLSVEVICLRTPGYIYQREIIVQLNSYLITTVLHLMTRRVNLV